MEDKQQIKSGDYIIVQRQGYMKLHKLKQYGSVSLGNFLIEMDNIIGEKYYDTFQMKNQPNTKKLFTLEKIMIDEIPTISSSSSTTTIDSEKNTDNRHIIDDGQSQSLTKDQIDLMKMDDLNSNQIVEKLISNSKTFQSKTEYSQEKYIKKKERKYFEYIQIRRPTIRLLAQIFHRQDPIAKTLGIRIDDLSQLLTLANIDPLNGNHLLYDSGTSGLMSAAILERIGASTSSKLVHMHPGNECQRNAVLAMQFPREQLERCINVNLYSVLRCFHQNKSSFNDTNNDNDEPDSKRIKLNDTDDVDDNTTKIQQLQRPNWQFDNEKACRVLLQKVDSLIVTAKEHPVGIVKELIPFLNGSRSIVVFSLYREPLQDLYVYLKSRLDFISLQITTNFMRNYQILPERTHPDVTHLAGGGYILSGYKLCV